MATGDGRSLEGVFAGADGRALNLLQDGREVVVKIALYHESREAIAAVARFRSEAAAARQALVVATGDAVSQEDADGVTWYTRS